MPFPELHISRVKGNIGTVAIIVILTAIYFAASKLGFSLAYQAEQVTIVWPPSGIALAALLLLGYRVWPGIALGAFLTNFTAHESFSTAFGIACGNTLEALCGIWLLHHLIGFHNILHRVKDVLGLVFFSAIMSTMVSATIGVTTLCLGGVQPWTAYGSLWLVWWLGDATGILMVAPVLLVWSKWPDASWWVRRQAEGILLMAGLLTICAAVFSILPISRTMSHGLIFLISPIIIWGALRFGQLGTSFVTVVTSAIAIWATMHGFGPFTSVSVEQNLTLLQIFMAVTAVTGLLLSAAISERNIAQWQQQAVLKVSRILTASDSAQEAILHIMQTICENLEWDLGAFWELDSQTNLLRCVELWHNPTLQLVEFEEITRSSRFPLGIGLPGRVFSQKIPIWVADVTKDKNFPRASVAAKEGLYGAFSFPILQDDRILGLMEFFSREIRQPDNNLLRMFSTVGNQIGQFMKRKHSEQALRISEASTRLMIDNALDGIVTIDQQGLITEWNRQAEVIFGWSHQEALGKSLAKLIIPHAYRDAHAQGMQRFLTDGSSNILNKRIEVDALNREGETFPIELTVTDLKLGECYYFTAFIRDITGRKKSEAALKEADRRKDEFLATLAHELRNPLAPLSNALNILQLPGVNVERSTEAIGIMRRQTQQIIRLVDDLLDVSRISHGKIELRKEHITLNEAVNHALETAKPPIEAAGHTFSVQLPDHPLWLNADLIRLSQILVNLLNNAAKYTPPRGHIWLEVEKENNMVMVRIRDTGMGIPANMLPKIFDMFTQVDSSIEKSHGGLGIGLMLVKSLVELHGGNIEAHSKGTNQGSEFVIRLPLAVSQQRADIQAIEVLKEIATGKLRVLVVDDNHASAQTLGWMAEMLGHEVQLAHDSISALNMAKSFLPEVILLDIGLPGMSGYEVCKKMREEPLLQHSLIVAQTGWGQQEHRQRSKEAGFDQHMVKPVKIDDLEKLFLSLGNQVSSV
jgi:PAS domain S-box-containing protein